MSMNRKERAMRDRMTEKMIKVMDEMEELMRGEIGLCDEMIKKAEEAGHVSLPATNENGVAILQDTKIAMNDIAWYWKKRKMLLSEKLYMIEMDGVENL